MAGKGDELQRRLLQYIFQTSSPSTSGAMSCTSTSTTLWVSLYTAFPGNDGTRGTNELSYGSYARQATSRTANGADGWTITGPPYRVFPNSEIRFPNFYGDLKLVTNWWVGTSSDYNADSNAALLYIGSYPTPQDPRKVGLGLTTDSYVTEE